MVSFFAVVALLMTLAGNAAAPSELLVVSSQVLALVALSGAFLSAAFGLRYLVARKPDLRRALLFVGALTLVVFIAHLYVVNSPPTFTDGTVGGLVGSTFGDSHLLISSSKVTSNSLFVVNITDVGDSAVGNLSLYLDNRSLPVTGFVSLPSNSDPLLPSSSTQFRLTTEVQGNENWHGTINVTSASSLRLEYQLLTCYHVPNPGEASGVFGCVMDEVYYVPTALGILDGIQCAPYAPGCNLEHPPLAKALIAAGMAVFGVNDLGWRASNIILGTLSIPLLFGLVLLASGNKRLAYFSTVLLALDMMFFVHSSIGVIDVPIVFFSLVAFISYFWKVSLWKIDNYVAAGVFLGLAALSKETALFSLLALVNFELLFRRDGLKPLSSRLAKMTLATVAVFIGAIQLFDTLFTSGVQPWFYQHIGFMLSYGSGLIASVLACSPTTGYWCKFPSMPGGPPILPTDWLLFYTPVAYLVTRVTVSVVNAASVTYIAVGYYGMANPVVVWMVFACVPLLVYRLRKDRHTLLPVNPETRFGAFLLVWLAWAYIPYILLFLYGRVTYPFYIIPAIPALAGGAAYFITRDFFPPRMALVYVLGAFAIFFLYFPVKDFLPVAIRAILGH